MVVRLLGVTQYVKNEAPGYRGSGAGGPGDVTETVGGGASGMIETSDFSVGLVCHPERSLVETLEALPIDSLWVGGHVASANPSPEALVQLARLAALTSRVRIGTSILLLPLYPPAIVAKQIADLDQATAGRVTLGIGVGGEYPQEFRACQIPLGERGARADEAIPLIRRLWSGEEQSHVGRFYSMDGVRIHPAPAQPHGPPIIVAGRKERAMQRAAALGDGWMPYLYSARRYAESVRTIRGLADEAGRDLTTFEWLAFVFVNVDDDGDKAKAETAQFLGGTYRQDFEKMLSHIAVAGTPHEVVAGLADFVRAGATHLVFTPATRTRTRSESVAARLANEIVPRVRSELR
jgi:probable F420-dependent oxidoreductase